MTPSRSEGLGSGVPQDRDAPAPPLPPAGQEGRGEEWWVVDHDSDRRLRGPFANVQAAGAVRREMERHHPWDVLGNLWVVESPTLDEGNTP